MNPALRLTSHGLLLRRAVVEGHVVFFWDDETRVTVVRVLHQRTDVGRV